MEQSLLSPVVNNKATPTQHQNTPPKKVQVEAWASHATCDDYFVSLRPLTQPAVHRRPPILFLQGPLVEALSARPGRHQFMNRRPHPLTRVDPHHAFDPGAPSPGFDALGNR